MTEAGRTGGSETRGPRGRGSPAGGPAPAGPDVSRARGRGAVAASILAVLLLGGYLAAAPGGLGAGLGEYLLSGAIVGVAFVIPALRIGGVADLKRQWLRLVLWILAWAVVWDVTTSGVIIRRELFQDWWSVYPGVILTLVILLVLHALVMEWTARRARGRDRGSDAAA